MKHGHPPPHHHRHPHHPPPPHQRPPHHGAHVPPHVRASIIRIQYDESAMETLSSVYGEATDFAIEALERCPVEVKLGLCMALGLSVDLSDYDKYVFNHRRFPSPLINETTLSALEQEFMHDDVNTVTRIYDECPPEQALLGIAIAALKHRNSN